MFFLDIDKSYKQIEKQSKNSAVQINYVVPYKITDVGSSVLAVVSYENSSEQQQNI